MSTMKLIGGKEMSGALNSSTRTVSVIMLFAFLNFVAGCTAMTNRSLDEVEKRPERTIPAVVLRIEIEGIRLSTGGEIQFNELRGRYNPKAGWIRGVTPVGDSVEIRLNETDWVLLREAGIDGPRTVMVDAGSFKDPPQSWKVIDGRSVRPGNVVRFGGAGGRYDVEKQLITGITENGKYVEIAVDEVLFVQHRKFSAWNTVGIVGLFFVGSIILWAAQGFPLELYDN